MAKEKDKYFLRRTFIRGETGRFREQKGALIKKKGKGYLSEIKRALIRKENWCVKGKKGALIRAHISRTWKEALTKKIKGSLIIKEKGYLFKERGNYQTLIVAFIRDEKGILWESIQVLMGK